MTAVSEELLFFLCLFPSHTGLLQLGSLSSPSVVQRAGAESVCSLGASVKGFKKAMGDDEAATPAAKEEAQKDQDADFEVKSIQEQQQPAVKTEEQKSQNKEQV